MKNCPAWRWVSYPGVSYPVVSQAARRQYADVAKPSPSFAGSPVLLKLGVTIRALRLEKGISQEALADIAGIDRSYMGGIERGQQNLTVMNLVRVAAALNLKVHQLMERAGL
jgi:DNA-binding XRE family transcriptional regulator